MVESCQLWAGGKMGLSRRRWTSWTEGPMTAGSSGSPLTPAGLGGTGHGEWRGGMVGGF